MQNQPKYSDSINQISENYQGVISSQISKILSEEQSKAVSIYTYDDIPLRLFLEIADSGEFGRLVISGEGIEPSKLVDHWERIVERNSEENASFQYKSYFSLYQSYNLLIAKEFNLKVLFMLASLKSDHPAIAELAKMGYKIDVSTPDTYVDTLTRAMKKSSSLITKIKMKKNEIDKYQETHGSLKKQSYEDHVADLEFDLGWMVGNEITLAKFNRLKKRVKQKNDAMMNKANKMSNRKK